MLAAPDEGHAEVLTFSPSDRGRDAWLARAAGGGGRFLGEVRDRLFALAAVRRHQLLLDVLPGSGLLTWEALRRAPEGGVHAVTPDVATLRLLTQQAARLAELDRPVLYHGPPEQLKQLLPADLRFDRILSRSPFTRLRRLTPAAQTDLLRLLAAWLQPDGRLLIAQTIPRLGQRLYQLVEWQGVAETLRDEVAAAEEGIYASADDPLVSWGVDDVLAAAAAAGLRVLSHAVVPLVEERRLTPAHWDRWFGAPQAGERPTYAARLSAAGLDPTAVERIGRLYRRQLLDRTWPWTSQTLFLHLEPASGGGDAQTLTRSDGNT
jgi:putative ATPase